MTRYRVSVHIPANRAPQARAEYPFPTLVGNWTGCEICTTAQMPDGSWVHRVRLTAPGGEVVRIDDIPVPIADVRREAIVHRKAHLLPD